MKRLLDRWPSAGLALAFAGMTFAAAGALADTAPADFDFNLETATTGPTHAARSNLLSTSWLFRRPLGWQSVFWTLGAQSDNYDFASEPVRRLQDYALLAGLEYYVHGEKAAELTLRPGWYFGGRASRDAWDVPVDLVSGVPITSDLNGVVGFSNARFYHHALPIFGLVWTATPQLRVQLVYPEPTIEYTLTTHWTLHAGGELVGGGFLVESQRGHPSPVEYSSYRIGLGLSRTLSPRVSIDMTGGYEVLHNFDAFRASGVTRGHRGSYVKLAVTVVSASRPK